MVCLITGSSRGLGRSIALAFGKRGYRVVIHYKDKSKEADEVASQIKESMALKADVRDFREVKSLVEKVVKNWGRIDVLVNNAGIAKEMLLLRTSEKDFDELINVNLTGPFNFIRAAAPFMTKNSITHIINISSIAGVSGKAGLAAYSASKAGLIGLTKNAALELSVYNIMVNAILPGYMLTDMGIASDHKAREKALNDSLVKEFSNPDNVADFACYLAGTKGISGQVFNMDSRIL